MALINWLPPVYLVKELRSNALNSLIGIWMKPNTGPNWKAVYAQELFEFNRRWLWLPLLPFMVVFFKVWWFERGEEMGHAIEIAVRANEGENIDEAEDDEIRGMLHIGSIYDRQGLWKQTSKEQLKATLVANRAKATKWVKRWQNHLDKVAQSR